MSIVDGQLALFATGLNGDITPRGEVNRGTVASELFQRWWEIYPAGRRRGPRQTALRAWRKAFKESSFSELLEQLHHYIEARELYREHFGEDAPLMHGATFLNSKRDLWNDAWGLGDVQSYWPAPEGWKPDAKSAGSRLSRILAEQSEPW